MTVNLRLLHRIDQGEQVEGGGCLLLRNSVLPDGWIAITIRT